MISGLNKLADENMQTAEEQFALIDPEVMTKFLEQEEITYDEESKVYSDKDGAQIELSNLLTLFQEHMARLQQIESLKEERAKKVL